MFLIEKRILIVACYRQLQQMYKSIIRNLALKLLKYSMENSESLLLAVLLASFRAAPACQMKG